jgi:hypothetical protein
MRSELISLPESLKSEPLPFATAAVRIGFSRSGLNAYVNWQTRFIKILAFKTAKVAGISELI